MKKTNQSLFMINLILSDTQRSINYVEEIIKIKLK